MKKITKDELPDNYPVHEGFLYKTDGVAFKSPITGDVDALKKFLRQNHKLQAKVISKYDFSND